MLYNIVLIMLVVYLMLLPLIVVTSIKFGIKLAEKPKETADEPIFNVPKPKKKPKVSKEEQKVIDILANIEAYDGTSIGQKEIK